ncbi:MAG: protein phosphatase 2C domain-containing protein [Buchananella hordeovulneris]|nr:protein phosphatase 2C domain-containing protein [Buchananella hordeovulneris]
MSPDTVQEAKSVAGAHLRVSFGVRSDVGRKRKLNEDAWGADFPAYFVADGMGGHRAGDEASKAVVEGMLRSLPTGEFATPGELASAIGQVAQDLSQLGAGPGAPGSTLTGIAFSDHRGLPCARVFNIGDSRTYLLSAGTFSQVTVDHSEVQELLDAGSVTEVEARALPRQNVITRALGAGSGPNVPADLFVVPVREGDRWLMCSDGLSGEVTDALIETVTRALASPQEVADELVSMALTAGGKDNVTVVVVDVLEASPRWSDQPVGDEAASVDDRCVEDTIPTHRERDHTVDAVRD